MCLLQKLEVIINYQLRALNFKSARNKGQVRVRLTKNLLWYTTLGVLLRHALSMRIAYAQVANQEFTVAQNIRRAPSSRAIIMIHMLKF